MVDPSPDPIASTRRAASTSHTAAPVRRVVSTLGWMVLGLQVLAGLVVLVLGGWLLSAVFFTEGTAPVGLGVAGGIIALFGVLLIVRVIRGRT